MSNFIDEAERHAELYGTYTDRQKEVLDTSSTLNIGSYTNNDLVEILISLGINESEIEWLKRTGHVMPIYR
ncbi:MAG: hypothetical protein MI865_03735 [Proteobacteria bacterium]|nr:hypothetical protein [Pseudomonadota bacterium]